jgi:WXXGXW repeat (2 copies)
MRPRAILPLLCATALTLIAVPGLARVGVVVGIAPPAPVVEPVPAPPAPGYVWQPGYWTWNGVQYVWVPGVYVVPPFARAVWVPGRWVRHGGGEIGWPASAAAGTFVGQFTTSDPSSGRKILRDALSPTENPPYRGNAISLFVGRPPCGLQRAPFQN